MKHRTSSVPDIIIDRTITAAPAEVFAAWTEPEEMGWIFNPRFPVERPPTVDLRVGGQWLLRMVIDSDTSYVTGGLYTDLVPARLVGFYWGAVAGWPWLSLDDPGDSPHAMITIGTLEDGHSRLRLVVSVPPDYAAQRGGMQAGWAETLDRLVQHFAISGSKIDQPLCNQFFFRAFVGRCGPLRSRVRGRFCI
jgi:uncharacterized protein YndB with AHSA1/START domain